VRANVGSALFPIVALFVGRATVGDLRDLALVGGRVAVVNRTLVGIDAFFVIQAATAHSLSSALVVDARIECADVAVGTRSIVLATISDRHVFAHVVDTVIERANVSVGTLAVLMTAPLDVLDRAVGIRSANVDAGVDRAHVVIVTLVVGGAAILNVDVTTVVILAHIDRARVVVVTIGIIDATSGDVDIDTRPSRRLFVVDRSRRKGSKHTLVVGAQVRVRAVGVLGTTSGAIDVGARSLFGTSVGSARIIVVAVGVLFTAVRNRRRHAMMSLLIARVNSTGVRVHALFVSVAAVTNRLVDAHVALAGSPSALVVVARAVA
jgi:hypothetical protein